MMERHEIAQLALDCALHGMPEPEGVDWRVLLPVNDFVLGDDGLGYLRSGRSANIETMLVSAWVGFVATGVAPKKERGRAVGRAADLLGLHQRAFLANEFGSTIYSAWTVMAWAALAENLAALGEGKLAAGYRSLVTQWLALARAAMTVCPADGLHVGVKHQGKGGREEALDESRRAGDHIVVLCGERSWGHGHGLAYYHHDLAAIAFGLKAPPPAARVAPPGRVDKWLERAVRRLLDLLRECAAPAQSAYMARDWPALACLLKYPAAAPCELRLYSDFSRIFVHGADETEPVDEDQNSNTPRIALMAVYRTPPRILTLPPWPAPNTGDTRIRQTGVWSDIDRDIHGGGWVLAHSDVGEIRSGDRWLSKAPDPPPSAQLIARFVCFGRSDGWVYVAPPPPAPIAPPGSFGAELPAASDRGRRRRRRPFWRRLLGLD